MSNYNAHEPKNGGGIFSYLYEAQMSGRDHHGRFLPVRGVDEDPLWDHAFENGDGPADLVIRQETDDYDLYLSETREEAEMRYFDSHEDDPADNEDVCVQDDFPGVSLNGKSLTDQTARRIGIQVTLDDEYELMTLPQYEDGDEFDHLPTRRSDSAAGRFPGMDVYYKARIHYRWNVGDGDRQRFVKIRGKKIRKGRQNTHHQMDNIWMTEMTDLESGLDSWGVMQAYLDAHSALETARIEAWWDGHYYDRLLNVNGINENFIQNVWLQQEPHANGDFDWDAYHDELMFIEEERQRREQWHYMNLDEAYNCGEFGYYDRKGPIYVEFYVGMEEDLKAAEEYNSIRHTGLFSSEWDGMDDYDFWDVYDYYQDDSEAEADYYEAEAAADEARHWQALADMEPTQEEWDAMDDVIRAEEAEKDALEQQFEHIPMSNAQGTKARLAQRVFINA